MQTSEIKYIIHKLSASQEINLPIQKINHLNGIGKENFDVQVINNPSEGNIWTHCQIKF